MILNKNQKLFVVREDTGEAFHIGTTCVYVYDPYEKRIRSLKDNFSNYTFELSLHNLNSFNVSRCRATVASNFNSHILIEG